MPKKVRQLRECIALCLKCKILTTKFPYRTFQRDHAGIVIVLSGIWSKAAKRSNRASAVNLSILHVYEVFIIFMQIDNSFNVHSGKNVNT